MKLLLCCLLWCALLAWCWPVALLALLIAPVVWLVTLPFQLLFHLSGAVLGALFGFITALLWLPARLLGYRGRR